MLPPITHHLYIILITNSRRYVNVFHLLLKDKRIADKDREFTINLAALFGPTLGITLASICILLLDNFFLT